MNTVTVSAAVSAVVTVIVGTALHWGARVVGWMRQRLPADHAALTSGSGWLAARTDSATDQVRVLVCCAPSRSLRRKRVDPDKAIRFVQDQFPGLFPAEPVFSMPGHGVRFDAPDGAEHGYAWVHASGRIDLCTAIPTTPANPGPIAFSVLDMLEPLLLVLRAVRSDAYDDTFGARAPGFARKFDWGIAVSSTVQVPGRGGVSWQDLVFPGRRPRRAGTDQRATCPPDGYAAAELRDWRPRRPAADLVRVFLREMLHENGFHDVEPAIADVIDALGAEPTDQLGGHAGPRAARREVPIRR